MLTQRLLVHGSPRIHVELKEQKVTCSLNRVARLMKLEGITAKQKRKFVRTTDSNHDLPVKENKLNQEFVAAMPDEKWAADMDLHVPEHRVHLHLDNRGMAVFSSSTGLIFS